MAYRSPDTAAMGGDRKKEALPEANSRKGKGKMKGEELRKLMNGMLAQAHNFVDSELSPERAKATQFYKAEKVGDLAPEEGRSSFVLSEVRDVVDGTLPSFARVIFGPERVLEFQPKTAEAVERAKQQSDYVRYVFNEDNPGFMNTLAVWKDGLIRRMGIFKWAWETTHEVKHIELEGVTNEELEAALISEDENVDIELVDATETDERDEFDAPLLDATLKLTKKDGRARHYAVPPEEFWMDRDARTVEDALLIAHATRKTKGELLDLGVKQEDIDEYGADDISLEDSVENIARRDTPPSNGDPADAGEANEKILYVEAYPLIDYDGDGRAELRKICTIGPTFYPVSNHPVNSRPFSVYVPFPEPHTLVGNSLADKSMDMQRTKSLVMRSIFNSLAQSITPRIVYQQGYANLQDILNTALGSPIRATRDKAVEMLTTPFVGADAMPVMDLLNGIMQRRVGMDPAVGGALDTDALQSTTPTGVNAAVNQSYAQIELMIRIFVEGTLKPMFKGISELLREHQPIARLVKMRGRYVEVNPKDWDDSDVVVRSGLGVGYVERKIAILEGVAAKQENIIAQYGPSNPMVTVGMYRNTLAKALELSDMPDTEEYFKVVPPDWEPPAPPEPPPSPEQILAQAQLEVEKIKTEREFTIKQAELEQKREQAQMDHEFNMRKMVIDAELRLAEMNQAAATNTENNAVKAQIAEGSNAARVEGESARAEVQRDIEGARAEIELADRAQAADLAERQHTADVEARDREQTAAEEAAAQQAAQAAQTEGA